MNYTITLTYTELISIAALLGVHVELCRDLGYKEEASEHQAILDRIRSRMAGRPDPEEELTLQAAADARFPAAVDYLRKHISHCLVCPALVVCKKTFKDQPVFGGTECSSLINDWMRLSRMVNLGEVLTHD